MGVILNTFTCSSWFRHLIFSEFYIWATPCCFSGIFVCLHMIVVLQQSGRIYMNFGKDIFYPGPILYLTWFCILFILFQNSYCLVLLKVIIIFLVNIIDREKIFGFFDIKLVVIRYLIWNIFTWTSSSCLLSLKDDRIIHDTEKGCPRFPKFPNFPKILT